MCINYIKLSSKLLDKRECFIFLICFKRAKRLFFNKIKICIYLEKIRVSNDQHTQIFFFFFILINDVSQTFYIL